MGLGVDVPRRPESIPRALCRAVVKPSVTPPGTTANHAVARLPFYRGQRTSSHEECYGAPRANSSVRSRLFSAPTEGTASSAGFPFLSATGHLQLVVDFERSRRVPVAPVVFPLGHRGLTLSLRMRSPEWGAHGELKGAPEAGQVLSEVLN